MRGPGASLRRPKLQESGESYPGAIYLGPRIIAVHSPTIPDRQILEIIAVRPLAGFARSEAPTSSRAHLAEGIRPEVLSRRILPRWRIEVTTRADFKSGFAPADGARIHFESACAGPAVVFIHAGVSDRRMWDPQFDYFADKFHVVRYDLRGFGKSEKPDLSYSNRADLGKVLQFLGIEKAALVGCSMGGSTAIDFTLEHPERVVALVTVGSGVSG